MENMMIRKLPWNGRPRIGWWQDNKTVTMYHGTHLRNLESVSKNGIDRFDPNTGMISMAFEPNTAYGYAAMSGAGGEANFRKVGAKPVNTPKEERMVLVFEIPMDFIKKHYDPKFSGNTPKEKEKITNKLKYKPGADFNYYALTELRFKAKIPVKYLVGYMLKN